MDEPAFSKLSTEQLLALSEAIEDPSDILALSGACKWAADVLRDPWPWTQRLLRGGWDTKAIIRQAGGAQDWKFLALAASYRYVIEKALDQLDGGEPLTATGSSFWSKLFSITASLDSNHKFFDKVAVTIAQRAFDIVTPSNALERYHAAFVLACFVYHGASKPELDQDLFKQWEECCKKLQATHSPFLPPGFLVDFRWATQPWETSEPELAGLDLDFHYTGITYLTFSRFLCAMVAKSASLNLAMPSNVIPSRAFDPVSRDGHPTPILGIDQWFTRPESKVIGYYCQGHGVRPEVHPNAISPIPMHIAIKADGDSFSGEGVDAVGDFTVEDGHMEGLILSFKKQYTGAHAWTYRGVALPWGLIGYWLAVNEAWAWGEFCLWPVNVS